MPTNGYWDRLMDALPADRRAAALALRDRLAELGHPEPEAGAAAEIDADAPELARFLALRSLWPTLIDSWAAPGALESLPAGRRLLAAGADADDLARLARNAAQAAAFGVLHHLTGMGRDPEAPADTPGWALMETRPAEAAGEDVLTGRTLESLHEDLITLDPSGEDGADLLR
ncbi:hypothetical protein [Allonocardiopsis opalescens]|nr:hypothetical protein [Allonocardiopsis opalescens]